MEDTLTAPVKKSFSLYSSPFEVRSTLEAISKELSGCNLMAEEVGSAEIVLAEVLNNIVEHAYAEDPGGKIDVSFEYVPGDLRFCLNDQGNPMPDGQTPLGSATNLDVEFDDLPEGGFGWFLIGELARDVEYLRVGETNRLTFGMKVGAQV